MERSRRSTVARRDMARRRPFAEVSPEVGQLDEAALDRAMADDPDEALALLADMVRATDPRLRDLARRLAGRLVVDVARRGPVAKRGTGRIESLPYRPDAGDVDLDQSADAILHSRATRSAVDPAELRVRSWVRPDTALCLLLDRSGSMQGRPLATNAVAAAAVALRCEHGDYSVVSFAADGVAVKSQGSPAAVERVVDDVLALRGSGTTDLTAALRMAATQLDRSRAGRRLTVLLSDCRATEPGDVVAAAGILDELVIVAPTGDDDSARELARATGAAMTTVAGPSDVPSALAHLLG